MGGDSVLDLEMGFGLLETIWDLIECGILGSDR